MIADICPYFSYVFLHWSILRNVHLFTRIYFVKTKILSLGDGRMKLFLSHQRCSQDKDFFPKLFVGKWFLSLFNQRNTPMLYFFNLLLFVLKLCKSNIFGNSFEISFYLGTEMNMSRFLNSRHQEIEIFGLNIEKKV